VNVGSLFTGVGGFDLGLERAGHNIVFQCESDAYRRRVLRRHWPDVTIYEDVRGEITGDIDLLCGGFPCQDLSVAGKRAGLAGDRSGLFFDAARHADNLLGDGGWLLIENVPGLLSSNEGRDMGVVIGTLADLGFTDLSYRTLDSRYFGVPQRRRRVFILARRATGRRALQVLLEPEGSGRDNPTGRKAGEGSTRPSQRGPADPRRGDISYAVTSKWVKGNGGPSGDECQNLVAGEAANPDGVRAASRLPGRVDDAPVTSPVDLKPDGRRYAAMGDAVTVNVAQWIGQRLNEHGGDG
jgi:DNA (cytosine-5)-methyltransferase 1